MITIQNLTEAEASIASTLRKNEKAYASMESKHAKAWQLQRLAADIENSRTLLAVIRSALHPENACGPSCAKLAAARDALPGYRARIEKVLPKFQPGTSQHTLAIRRIRAYAAAEALIQERLSER